jgi:hypothetical protein
MQVSTFGGVMMLIEVFEGSGRSEMLGTVRKPSISVSD